MSARAALTTTIGGYGSPPSRGPERNRSWRLPRRWARAGHGFSLDGLQHRADRIGIALSEIARRTLGQVLQLIELTGGDRFERQMPLGEALQSKRRVESGPFGAQC